MVSASSHQLGRRLTLTASFRPWRLSTRHVTAPGWYAACHRNRSVAIRGRAYSDALPPQRLTMVESKPNSTCAPSAACRVEQSSLHEMTAARTSVSDFGNLIHTPLIGGVALPGSRLRRQPHVVAPPLPSTGGGGA